MKTDMKIDFWTQDAYILFLGDSTKLKICYTLLEMSYVVYRMNFYDNFDNSSCQIWKLPILKVDKFERWQNWKLPRLNIAKIENFQSWQNQKLLSC